MSVELTAGGARALILPEYGGRLHQLWVPGPGSVEALLFSPDEETAYSRFPTRGGSFPMAPWPNRVADGRFRWLGHDYELPRDGRPHATHGRVLGRRWEVVAATPASCELVVAFDAGWPWRGHARQRFELSPTTLRMELEVWADDEPFPAGCGWHPWFRHGVAGARDVRLLVPARDRYVMRDQIPTGERAEPSGDSDLRGGPLMGSRRLDDCYSGLDGAIGIDWGPLRLKVTVESREPHVMVHTPPEAFCIEPQTCAPDAFNLADRGVPGTGVEVATSAAPVRITSRWSWSTPTDAVWR